MASQNPSTVSGKAGSVIYYVYNGKQYVKARGKRRIRQTDATKTSASRFGLISGLSKTIRSVLPDSMKPLNNRETRNRLTAALVDWMHIGNSDSTKGTFISIHGVSQFEFNKEAPLKQKLKVPLEVKWDHSGKVIVSIPELKRDKHIPLPHKHLEYLELWIYAVSCVPADGDTTSYQNTVITIPCKSGPELIPAQQVELPVSVLSGTLNVVVAGLEYVFGGGHRTERFKDTRWMPARILDAVYIAD
jgi:hypothetical protein